MVEAIIFDWHGVLDKRTFNGFLCSLAKQWYDKHQVQLNEFCTPSVSLEAYRSDVVSDIGRLAGPYALSQNPEREFWDWLGAKWHAVPDEAKQSMLSVEQDEGVWRLLAGLKLSYKLAILSDCPKDKGELIRKTQDLNLFDVVCFSYETCLLKDERGAYDVVSRKLQLPPTHCVLVDDSIKNTVYASNLGFQAAHFRNSSDLEKQLSTFRKA